MGAWADPKGGRTGSPTYTQSAKRLENFLTVSAEELKDRAVCVESGTASVLVTSRWI